MNLLPIFCARRNYDENLIYVNDFEVFRPYLVRSGQQEGLSFINPEMARNINFYNGGFPGKVWRQNEQRAGHSI